MLNKFGSLTTPIEIAILIFLIGVLVALVWNGWVGYNMFREDKKVQPTEVHIEVIQKEFEYSYAEAYTYTFYYNLLNAINLKNRHEISYHAKVWPEKIIDGDISADKAKEIIKKAERDFYKLYPSH